MKIKIYYFENNDRQNNINVEIIDTEKIGIDLKPNDKRYDKHLLNMLKEKIKKDIVAFSIL
jgi:hypothetical protein